MIITKNYHNHNRNAIIFHVSYLILLLLIIFYLLPTISNLLTFGPFLLIPLGFITDSFKKRFHVFLLLLIPFIFLNFYLISYPDSSGLVVFTIYPAMIFILILISHLILNSFKEKISDKLRLLYIIITLILILLFLILNIIHINKTIIDFENQKIFKEIKCKGAYTTTLPSELESLCGEIKIGGYEANYWKGLKSYCDGLVEKISLDKYYFDEYVHPDNIYAVRNLRNEEYCASAPLVLRDYVINERKASKFIPDDYNKITSPQVEDPYLCELSDNKPYCYSRVAGDTKNLSYCKNVDSCYELIVDGTSTTNDFKVSACNSISNNDTKYWCLARLLDDRTYCEKMSSKAAPNCYRIFRDG